MSYIKSLHYLTPRKGTSTLIDIVLERVKEGDIPSIVLASRKGNVAVELGKALKGSVKVVSVTEFTYNSDITKQMKKLKIVAIEKAQLPIQDRREMREALEMFGVGVKAALEVASIAAKEGLVSEKPLAIAGKSGGLDSALVVRPAAPKNFSNPDPTTRMAVLEILELPTSD